LALASLRERSTLGCDAWTRARRIEIARHPSARRPRSLTAGRGGRRPADGRKTDQFPPRRLARPAVCQPVGDRPHAQHSPVGMRRRDPLVLVDLPVNVVVILEQQERAGQAQRAKGALGDRAVYGGEHVFARYARRRTDHMRTRVRVRLGRGKRRCRANRPARPCKESCIRTRPSGLVRSHGPMQGSREMGRT
jgi:hypothetical protein